MVDYNSSYLTHNTDNACKPLGSKVSTLSHNKLLLIILILIGFTHTLIEGVEGCFMRSVRPPASRLNKILCKLIHAWETQC